MKRATAYIIRGIDLREDPVDGFLHPFHAVCLDKKTVRRLFEKLLPRFFAEDDTEGHSFEECLRLCHYQGKAGYLKVDGAFPCYGTAVGGRER